MSNQTVSSKKENAMKKSVISIIFMGIAVTGGEAIAYGCNNWYEIMRSANELGVEASHFAGQVRNAEGYDHLATYVEEYAERAGDLYETAGSSANCAQTEAAFDRVTAAEGRLKRVWELAHNSHHNLRLERDFQELGYAYTWLWRAVENGHGGSLP
jgi:hypothetical protein